MEFEIGGKVHRIGIDQPLKIVSKKDFEAENENLPNLGVSQSSLSLAKNQEAVAKLPEPCFKVLDDYNISDAAEMPNSYIRFIERSAEEMDGEVEYDMDEEDVAWLLLINQKRVAQSMPEVSVDTFELLMDRLEKESYFQMQSHKGGDTAPVVIDDDAVCCICLDGECQNSNVILFCDMCNLAVHQDCYGVPYIPEGQWLCRRCLQSPSRAVDCVLCPNNAGAFKQTDRGHWAHVVCALWIPEVRFANTVFLEPIDSIETIPPARWKLTCYICKQRGVGACIQCHKTNCFSAFHVTCAQQAGLYMKMDTVRHIHTVGSDPGQVMVQKTAYCEAHTPPDVESRPRPAPSLASDFRRQQLAKKRTSIPVISIPTIPPDRIQEIGSLVNLAKKSQFIQRLIAYWTLKRQFRNGVPLLRRLQSTHLARREEVNKSTSQATSDISELYRQLKYWQCLRQDLERARLLCELVRKREKLKKELVKVKSQCIEVELCPLICFLRNLVELLRVRDTGEIFIEPVDQSEVPDYGDVVKHPMDLSTMRHKVDNFQYNNLEEFQSDFYLMIDNCLAYNSKDTVFYRAALKMRDQGGMLLRQAARDLESLGLEGGLGLLSNGRTSVTKPVTPSIETLPAEIDKQLIALADPNNTMGEDEVMCKLLQLLDSCQNLKHGLARAKRIKMVKAEIAKLKKKSTVSQLKNKDNDTADSSDDEPLSKSVAVNDKKSSPENTFTVSTKRPRRKKTWDDFLEGQVTSKQEKSQLGSSTTVVKNDKIDGPTKGTVTPTKQSGLPLCNVSPSGVNRRTAVLFTRKAAAATSKMCKPDEPTTTPTINTSVRRRGRQPKKNFENSGLLDSSTETVTPSSSVPCKDSFSVYRSGGEIQVESDEESHSDDKSSCSVCSSSDGSSDSGSASGSSDYSDSDESVVSAAQTSESEALEQLQLVWAKCRGYPWYPALIINPKMPRGYIHNGVPIPSPPADVLALANNYTEPVYLVLFFDTKRTWQWLPRNKLEPLGITPELDQIKLLESRKPTDRKAVRKAYQEALTHRTQVDKKEEIKEEETPVTKD